METQSVWTEAFASYLDDGGDVNAPNVFLSSPHLGKTLLIRAIELNKLSTVQKLLDSKANPNVTHSKTSQSPLSYVLSRTDPDPDTLKIAQLIIDAGADINRVDEFTFMSPLFHAFSTPTPFNVQNVCLGPNWARFLALVYLCSPPTLGILCSTFMWLLG